MTRNQLTYWANQETIRSNLAREAETNRANKEKESADRYNIRIKERDSYTNKDAANAKAVYQYLSLIPQTLKGIGSIL